jgi:hypothetical protein
MYFDLLIQMCLFQAQPVCLQAIQALRHTLNQITHKQFIQYCSFVPLASLFPFAAWQVWWQEWQELHCLQLQPAAVEAAAKCELVYMYEVGSV